MGDSKSVFYGVGIGVGIIIGIILVIFIKMMGRKKEKVEFDERQLLARQHAYCIGFFTLLLAIAVNMVLKLANICFWVEPLNDIFCIFLAIGAFAGEAIKKDAFIGFSKNLKSQMVLYILIIVAQLVNSILAFVDGEMFVDGKMTLNWASVFCVVVFAYVIVMQLLASAKMKREEEEDFE